MCGLSIRTGIGQGFKYMNKSSKCGVAFSDVKQKLSAARKIRDLAHKREIRLKTKGKTAAQRMLGE